MQKKTSCEIILGSYEEFILGFKYNKKDEEAQQTFAVHSHAGSIRCVATSGDLLASGGSDDRIVIYNLKSRKEHCLLTHHNGTVNCLQFTDNHTHLISGGHDGMLAIIRVGNWQLEKVWENAHKGAAILDIAVHSSGKLALTLGADATLRTWNLVKGRQAYVTNLNSKCKEPKCLHSIQWAHDNVRFVLVGSSYTDIWSIQSGGVLKSIRHKHKVSSCTWYSDEKLIVGYEDGHIGIVDVTTEEIAVHKAHQSRVKCLAMHGSKLITASSSGEVKVWSTKLNQLCVADAGCRFTCMCLVQVENSKLDANESIVEVIETTLEDKEPSCSEETAEEVSPSGMTKKKRAAIKTEERPKVKRPKKTKINIAEPEVATRGKVHLKSDKNDNFKQKQKKKLKQKACQQLPI